MMLKQPQWDSGRVWHEATALTEKTLEFHTDVEHTVMYTAACVTLHNSWIYDSVDMPSHTSHTSNTSGPRSNPAPFIEHFKKEEHGPF